MARNKKRVRINKKKAHRKVVVKRQTPDQKAKENDMMKILLSRPMMGPAPAQQNQQNDKLVEKLEAATRKENELRRQNDNLESALTRRRQDIEVQRDRREDIHNRENLIEENERRERQQEEHERHVEQLQRVQNQFDVTTEAGQAHAQEVELNNQIRQLRRNIEDAQTEQRRNTMYQAIQPLREERDRLEAQKAIVDGVFQSNDWINSKEAYTQAAREKYLSEISLEQAKLIANKKRQAMLNEADKEALQLAENALDAPQPRQAKTLTGLPKTYNGKPVFEKEAGKIKLFPEESKRNQYKRELADVNTLLSNSQLELASVKARSDNTQKELLDLKTKQVELDNMIEEIKATKKYMESQSYTKRMTLLEEQRQKVAKRQAQIDVGKAQNEQLRKMKDIEIRADIASHYSKDEEDTEQAMTAIKALGEEIERRGQELIAATQVETQLNAAREEMTSTFNSLLDKYGQAGQNREIAKRNLFNILADKSNKESPTDLQNYSYEDTMKATQFMRMLSEVENVLTDEGVYNEFKDGYEYKEFKW